MKKTNIETGLANHLASPFFLLNMIKSVISINYLRFETSKMVKKRAINEQHHLMLKRGFSFCFQLVYGICCPVQAYVKIEAYLKVKEG